MSRDEYSGAWSGTAGSTMPSPHGRRDWIVVVLFE
jgi:hypothetical protein